MDAKELLARIEKLPEGWRHPLAEQVGIAIGVANSEGFCAQLDGEQDRIALDLHLRHIAEKAAGNSGGFDVNEKLRGGVWYIRHDQSGRKFNSYAEALVTAAEDAVADAAEECNKQ